MTANHEIRISTHLNPQTGKWEIRISGVTSGVKINGGDGDNMNIEFQLDAYRFQPIIRVP